MNACGWNIINSIHSIRTYINTSIIFLPTILLSILCPLTSTLFQTFRSRCMIFCGCSHLAVTWLARSIFVSLIRCSAISFTVALLIFTKSLCVLCPSFKLKVLEWQQLYNIWLYMRSLIICPLVYDPIYSSSNLYCSKMFFKAMYGTFGPPFLSMELTNYSQCLTSVYEAHSCLGPWALSFPFNTQRIIPMNVVFCNSGRLLLDKLPVHFPKCITSHLLPRLPFILTSQNSFAHCFQNISTDCQRIHSAW